MQKCLRILCGRFEGVDELTRGAGRAGAAGEGEPLRLLKKACLVKGHSARLGEVFNYRKICVLIGARECDLNTEPFGKRHGLLHCVADVNVVPLSVGKRLAHKVASVARRVYCDVLGTRKYGALKHRLQRAEIIVVFRKGQVVDENNK